MNPVNNHDITIDWNNYILSLESRLINMWSFINYNKFTDSQVEKYRKEATKLNRCIISLKNKLKKLQQDNNNNLITINDKNHDINLLNDVIEQQKIHIRNLTINNRNNKRTRDDVENENNESNESNEFINDICKKKPKTYEYLEESDKNNKLLEIFNNLHSITDIIKLAESNYVYDFLKSEKFKKLFKLIPSLKKLDQMIGMSKLKKQIFSMICYCLHQMNTDDDLNHIVIMGPPGTGKTSVSHIIGEIYYNLGFLSKGTFIKAKRSDLIAAYLGQTAIKTQNMIDKAEGGILFIDEVYSLGNTDNKDSFAKECIDTINQNLTEKSKNLLVIIAGYKDEVKKCFFNYNPGLERRFNLQFTIEQYTYDELYQILIKTIKYEKWCVSSIIEEFLKNEIKKNYTLFKYMGGDIQTLLKFAKENYSKRLMKTILTLESTKELIKEDFIHALEQFKEYRSTETPKIPEYIRRLYS